MNTSRNYWPLGVIAAFIFLIIGIIAVIVIATTHSDSMVSENYYEQELTFQNQIDSAARAQKSGAAIAADSVSENVTISVPASQLTQNFSGTIELYRPSDPKLDQTLKLSPHADGTQKLDSSKLAVGLWLVRLKWNAAGLDYFLEKKITVTGI